MHQTVKDHVLSCDRCQRIKVDHTRKNPPLNPLPVVGPFDRWHMDFLKLSKTNKGETYLLVLVDSCSKWVEAFAMKTQEASEVAKVLFKEVFSRFGAARFLDPRDHQLQPNEVVQNQANNADRVDQHDQSDENVPQAQNRENETTDGNDDQVEDHQFL
ncbi:Hypothetical predicted protein [Mytilus galloprovincialis]|uniref:Integrase catalytic domain-containing protein n=1 Tax=Mytilus galloprovincialis TaxID=29158 RepID=A0A8B6FHG7_MYTGA|nr:Hypothetical predicted protein [Mytilus galloprovincialis]